MVNTQFHLNSVNGDGEGGGLTVWITKQEYVHIIGCDFYGNYAYSWPGLSLISLDAYPLYSSVINTTIHANIGGGLVVWALPVIVSNCNISDNQALIGYSSDDEGAGAFFNANSTVIMKHTILTGNNVGVWFYGNVSFDEVSVFLNGYDFWCAGNSQLTGQFNASVCSESCTR